MTDTDSLKEIIDKSFVFYEVPKRKKEISIHHRVIEIIGIRIDYNKEWITYNGKRKKIYGLPLDVLYALCKRPGQYIRSIDLFTEIRPDNINTSGRQLIGIAVYTLRKHFGTDIVISSGRKGYSLNINYGRSDKENNLQVA